MKIGFPGGAVDVSLRALNYFDVFINRYTEEALSTMKVNLNSGSLKNDLRGMRW